MQISPATHLVVITILASTTVTCFRGRGPVGSEDATDTDARTIDTASSDDDSEGDGDRSLTAVVVLAAEGDRTCALLNSGDVKCWGRARFGQSGQGHTSIIGDTETPATVPMSRLGKPSHLSIDAGIARFAGCFSVHRRRTRRRK